MRFSARFAILIESGFPRENRNLFRIETRSFAKVNYCYARIINYKDDCLSLRIPPYCRSCSLFILKLLS